MKRKIAIGTDLWLVEGSIRWAIYDFINETIIQISKKAGLALLGLLNGKELASKKRRAIMQSAPDFYQALQVNGCFERLFERVKELVFGCRKYMLWVELTDACNQTCLQCYTRSDNKKKNFLRKEVLDRIINQASELKFEQIQLTGGEPLLYSGLWDAIRQIRDLGLIPVIEVYTNLTLLKKRDIQFLQNYKVKVATTLLGSRAEVHDLCTNRPSSFNLFMKNIRQIRDAGVEFRVGVVRLPENESDMEAIQELMLKENMIKETSRFSPDDVRPVGRAEHHTRLKSKNEWGLYLHIRSDYFQMAQHWNTCWGGEIAITASGDILPCIFARDQVLTSIYQESLKRVISSKLNKFWNINSDQIKRCKDCEYRYACMDCRVLAIRSGRGIFGAPVRCKYNPYE